MFTVISFKALDMSTYVYISSNASKQYFPANESTHFRMTLAKPLSLYGDWEVALTEINLPKLAQGYKPEYIAIECSFCIDSFVNGGQDQLLDRFFLSELRPSDVIRLTRPHYVKVNTDLLHTLQLNLYDETHAKPSFQSGNLHCTLHLRRCLE